ncbi:hypothetical protein B0H16DRAFT_1462887 [Mycena metata]|uniref:Uncharacterized protein n=1 Tax=Mycena metata TaxID=1033252 RepID=A0AAD7N4D1_9AGAR|nr:hypothetical protein B0H16DRAFT_1462887 [Mycena metata]
MEFRIDSASIGSAYGLGGSARHGLPLVATTAQNEMYKSFRRTRHPGIHFIRVGVKSEVTSYLPLGAGYLHPQGQGALCPSANWTLVTHRAVESVSDYARACHTIGGMYDFSQFKLGDSVDDLANGWIIAESLFTVFVWAFFFIAAYAARSNLRFLIDVTPGVVGTANILIYVRVGFYDGHTSLRPRRRRLLSDSRALNPLRVRSRDDTSRYYRPTDRRGREPLTLGEDAGSGTHVNGNKAV